MTEVTPPIYTVVQGTTTYKGGARKSITIQQGENIRVTIIDTDGKAGFTGGDVVQFTNADGSQNVTSRSVDAGAIRNLFAILDDAQSNGQPVSIQNVKGSTHFLNPSNYQHGEHGGIILQNVTQLRGAVSDVVPASTSTTSASTGASGTSTTGAADDKKPPRRTDAPFVKVQNRYADIRARREGLNTGFAIIESTPDDQKWAAMSLFMRCLGIQTQEELEALATEIETEWNATLEEAKKAGISEEELETQTKAYGKIDPSKDQGGTKGTTGAAATPSATSAGSTEASNPNAQEEAKFADRPAEAQNTGVMTASEYNELISGLSTAVQNNPALKAQVTELKNSLDPLFSGATKIDAKNSELLSKQIRTLRELSEKFTAASGTEATLGAGESAEAKALRLQIRKIEIMKANPMKEGEAEEQYLANIDTIIKSEASCNQCLTLFKQDEHTYGGKNAIKNYEDQLSAIIKDRNLTTEQKAAKLAALAKRCQNKQQAVESVRRLITGGENPTTVFGENFANITADNAVEIYYAFNDYNERGKNKSSDGVGANNEKYFASLTGNTAFLKHLRDMMVARWRNFNSDAPKAEWTDDTITVDELLQIATAITASVRHNAG